MSAGLTARQNRIPVISANSVLEMEDSAVVCPPKPGRAKFSDPLRTAGGELRARVVPEALRMLWFNTGTLCNLACTGCYIESSPRNNRLAYISRAEVRRFLAEATRDHGGIDAVGFTGGEPFMNPEIMGMLADALEANFRVLVLTNAMAPLRHHCARLLSLRVRYQDRLSLRVSLDHFTPEVHEGVRGPHTFAPAIAGLKWLSDHGFDIAVAARHLGPEDEATLRDGFSRLFVRERIAIDAFDSHRLVLFPEMDERVEVAEITAKCWTILNKSPATLMCASARMVVKRRGADAPAVVACTLLPYDARFELGQTLGEAMKPVQLNHPHCAKFCVLGGASCSA
jgi:sulfatase maturation enzyme AslB (radical SAM superfamily)